MISNSCIALSVSCAGGTEEERRRGRVFSEARGLMNEARARGAGPRAGARAAFRSRRRSALLVFLDTPERLEWTWTSAAPRLFKPRVDVARAGPGGLKDRVLVRARGRGRAPRRSRPRRGVAEAAAGLGDRLGGCGPGRVGENFFERPTSARGKSVDVARGTRSVGGRRERARVPGRRASRGAGRALAARAGRRRDRPRRLERRGRGFRARRRAARRFGRNFSHAPFFFPRRRRR